MAVTITTQTTDERLAKFENQVLAHPTLESVYTSVQNLIRRPAVPIIEVVGPTGVGKSTLLKKLHVETMNQFSDAMIKNPGIIPVILVEAPSPDSGAFHWGDF